MVTQRPAMATGSRTLRIGTRGSALALVQARWVAARLAEVGVPTELDIIRTEGDDRPVDTAWGEGAFVTAIEAALLSERVDVAVHSAKDVPTEQDPRLVAAAFPPREDPRDALVCRIRGTTLATLPQGARIGTDSPRRTAFLLAVRPDLQLHPLHGNVDTRLAKLDAGESDALILAVAGLTRLGRADRIDEILPPERVAPAPGQGSLAIQVRRDDADARAAVGRLDDPPTRAAVEAERALLAATGGGCRAPIGALGRVSDGLLTIVAGAARDLPADAGSPIDPVAWAAATGPVDARLELATGLADRLVRARTHPRVLVTRPDAQARPVVEALAVRGIDAVAVPTVEIRHAPAGGPLDDAVRRAARDATGWVVVTSPNGADALIASASRTGAALADGRVAAVGEATAARLRAVGIDDLFVPSSADGATLGHELPVAPGQTVLLARSDLADATLPSILQARGAVVEAVVAYQTIEGPAGSRPELAAALAGGPVDAIVAASGSALRGLLALVGPDGRERIVRTLVVAIGPVTADEAASLGFRRVLTAPAPRPEAIAETAAAILTAPTGALPADPVPALSGGSR
jgi:hydroxymethylbilane synthase